MGNFVKKQSSELLAGAVQDLSRRSGCEGPVKLFREVLRQFRRSLFRMVGTKPQQEVVRLAAFGFDLRERGPGTRQQFVAPTLQERAVGLRDFQVCDERDVFRGKRYRQTP